MTEHTPGPWEVLSTMGTVRVEHGVTVHDITVRTVPKGTEHHPVALVICHGNTPEDIAERDANAALFAAAPELLEALVEAEDELTKVDVERFGTVSQTVKRCRAAIAKAEPTESR